MKVFSDTICALGEGPFWHPERAQFFWFDILGKRMLSRQGDTEELWHFDEHVSAAGWVDRDRLLIASETALFTFDLRDGARRIVTPLEADNPVTRSNDGRADPQGGFWIGTMGKNAEPHAGSIWRFYKGELRLLFPDITVSNSICFAPDGNTAYFTDTWSRQIMAQGLDADGWPDGAPRVFIDLKAEGLNPDGSVVDAQGHLWNAQWGASRVARYDTKGVFVEAVKIAATQASCPCFGGADLGTLYVTSAAIGVDDEKGGMTFRGPAPVTGQAEHRVIL